MKAGIVGVPQEEFLKVATNVEGITVVQQKGFHKVQGNVPSRAVYVQNNKLVGEVHFSGFAADPKTKIPGLIANPKFPKPTRRVTHFLDQREGVVSKEQILSNFRKVISVMVTTESSEPVEFIPPAPEVPEQVVNAEK